jgi:hypothetical protein
MKKDDHLNLENRQPELSEDRELSHLLASWQTPESSGELDRRMLTSYRRHFKRLRLWQRWLSWSIRIPVPIAAVAMLLLCATSFLAVREATSNMIPPPPAAATEFVKIPVPVIQEKFVTRVIHLKAGQGNPKPDSDNPARGAKNATRPDLAAFRPVEEINIVVISEENKNEK